MAICCRLVAIFPYGMLWVLCLNSGGSDGVPEAASRAGARAKEEVLLQRLAGLCRRLMCPDIQLIFGMRSFPEALHGLVDSWVPISVLLPREGFAPLSTSSLESKMGQNRTCFVGLLGGSEHVTRRIVHSVPAPGRPPSLL